jgi:hypothetical protein
MKKKILGMFVCMLLMVTTVPAVVSFDYSISLDGDTTLIGAFSDDSYKGSAYVLTRVSVNRPPIFGLPTPFNGSLNNPRSLTWHIPINDPDGDAFSWTIQCSNGQVNSGTNDTNGTKSLALLGLTYSTTYTVWVNATDSNGSGLFTRKWYTFTTKINLPPIFGSPTPINGSTNNSLSLNWGIQINDSDGDAFSWAIQCSNGQTTSGTGASNGIKLLPISGLAYLTTYTVWVNATDSNGSGLYTRKWYTFTTKANLPPVFGTPSSANGSTNNLMSFTWSIPINDPDGDAFSWSIQCSNGQTTSGTGASNGTKSLALSSLTNSTTYKIWVNATDPTASGLYTRKWYTFTTMASQPPTTPDIDGPPSGKAGVSYNYNFVAVEPDGDDVYYRIEWGDGSAVTKWIGPYSSGQNAIFSHTFTNRGLLIIKCQAKDSHNSMSDWGQLEVTMPTVTSYIPSLFFKLIERLMERFPHAFPILNQLLGY